MNSHGKGKVDDEDGPSAADYDPTVDMQEDEKRGELRHGHVVLHGEHVVTTTEQQPQEEKHEKVQEEKPEKSSGDHDEDFDMFAEDFDEDKYATKPTAAPDALDANGSAPDAQAVAKGGILEGDDKDGYYKIRIGEVLNGRYQIQATLGKGMFSGVASALDITTKQMVAIKMMRNNDALRKGGYTEIAILQKLNDADPENRKHIVKFERSFDFNGHLCMAFESLSLNLREVLRKFGNNVGINLGATRTYAYQIFVALAHMRKCSIIHADLKPDNILVSSRWSLPCGNGLLTWNRLTRAATCSRFVIWAQLLIGLMLQQHTRKSRRTWSADSTAHRKSSLVCHTTIPLTCGPSAARCMSCTRARSCLQATATTKCSRRLWRFVAD